MRQTLPEPPAYGTFECTGAGVFPFGISGTLFRVFRKRIADVGFCCPWQAAARPPAAAFLPVCWVAREAPGQAQQTPPATPPPALSQSAVSCPQPPPHGTKKPARDPTYLINGTMPSRGRESIQTTHGLIIRSSDIHAAGCYTTTRIAKRQARRRIHRSSLDQGRGGSALRIKSDHLPVWTRQRVNVIDGHCMAMVHQP